MHTLTLQVVTLFNIVCSMFTCMLCLLVTVFFHPIKRPTLSTLLFTLISYGQAWRFDLGFFGHYGRCDRILWKGEGLKQMWYLRGESRFSDHRPVYSLFSVHVDIASKNDVVGATKSCTNKPSTNTPLASTCAVQIQAEEILLLTRAQSCLDTGSSRFWVTL